MTIDYRPRYSTGKVTHKKLEDWQKVKYIKRRKKTEIHHWSDKDVARVAISAVEHGEVRAQVLVAVADALGYGNLFCRLKRSIESVATLSGVVSKILSLVAEGAALRALIAWLTEAATLPLPAQVKLAIGACILVLIAIEDVAGSLMSVANDLKDLSEVLPELIELCEARNENV